MRLEALAPGRSRVGEQDVDVVRVLRHLAHQRLDALDCGAVGGDGDGARARLEVGEFVELRHGLLAGLSLPRGDEDFGASGLEEAVQKKTLVS